MAAVTWRERACSALSTTLLRSYRLSTSERREETERLTRALLATIDAELEGLEHRKVEHGG